MTEKIKPAEPRPAGRLSRPRWWIMGFVALWLFLFYVPLPYYVTQPGSALELAPIIQVEGGSKDEKGAFMLTTVRMGEATPAWYLYAKLSPDVELLDKNLVLGQGETDQDFTQRELEVMKSSQLIAEAVAFQRAGYPVKIENQGVEVMGTIAGMPAQNVLKVGDVITRVDTKQVLTADDLLGYLASKQPGESVNVVYLRGGREQSARLTLARLPDAHGENSRAGLGIRPDNKFKADIPKKVTISSEQIGGPSAGLMMTLEIYDQLKKEIDLTRGFRIAGTGTINPDGTVGRIGGINHKIVAADRAGAEIFFAPSDSSGGVSNYEEAVATAKRIGARMKIVPVKTVDDALNYLKALKPKGT